MFEADAALGALELAFAVGNYRMDPWELYRSLCRFSDHNSIMLEAILGQRGEGGIAIGSDGLTCLNSLSGYSADGYFVNVVHDVDTSETGSIPSVLSRHDDCDLVLSAATPDLFALTAKKCIVHFHEPLQLVAVVTFRHSLANLVPHHPDGLVITDSQQLLQTQHRVTSLVASHQEDHPKPATQGSPGPMKDRPRRDRRLITTVLALVKSARSMIVSLPALAAGAQKTVRPPLLKQVLPAFLFGAESLLELQKTYFPVHWSPPLICPIFTFSLPLRADLSELSQ